MSCFYCGSNGHRSAGCPSRSLEKLSNIEVELKNANTILENIEYSKLQEIASLGNINETLQDIACNVASLNYYLNVGFAGLAGKLRKIHSLLEQILPFPVRVEARDHYEIGIKVLRRGFYGEAKRKLLLAKNGDPSFFPVYAALGETHLLLGEDDGAILYFRLGEKIAETAEQKGYALLLMGRFFLSEGNYSEAIKSLERATQIQPKNALIWYALGACPSNISFHVI